MGRRVLFGAALSLILAMGSPAHAQKTKAELNTEVDTTFPDQMIGAITPSGVRAFQNDVINSIMPTAPVTSGNLACFDGVTGLLKDCTFAPNNLIVGSTAISLGMSKGILFNDGASLGNTNSVGGAVLATDASANPSLTVSPTLGVSGVTAGSLAFANTSSGTVTLQSASGALGSAVASLPAGTYTVVGDSLDQAISGKTRFTGTTAPASAAGNTVALGTLAAPPTLSHNGQAFLYNTASGGAVLQGAGSVYDAILMNKSGIAVAAVATGTTTLALAGGLNMSGLSSGSCTNGGLALDGSNNTVKTGCPSILIGSGTAALGTSAISSATCATVVTVSATNTATTDVVMASFNSDPTAVTGYVPSTLGMLTIFSYPTANNVNFKVCNNTAGSITPGAITLNWRVLR